jgi:predicted SAM-dependent methyltransferase
MKKSNQVFLFLSHCASARIAREYENIRRAITGIGNSFFLYHNRCSEAPPGLPEHGLYLFSDESLSKLNYPMIGPSLLPGHAGFPVLQFFHAHPDFDYYWVIEYDVKFSGDWRFFFDSFKDTKQDFLTCHIRDHVDEPDFPFWWLHHPRKSIPFSERLRSFNPIYRLSNASLSFLHHSLSDGWCGHFEVLYPTLLHHNGFAIMDIGGKGRFTPPGMKDYFYTESECSSNGELDRGTMRYRPSFWKVGQEKNKLYHPVKSLSFVMREKINGQKCQRLLRRLPSKFFHHQTLYWFSVDRRLMRKQLLVRLGVAGASRKKPRAKFLNVGSGPNAIQTGDWYNIDGFYPSADLNCDAARKLPFPDNRFEGIFAEHIFEHFTPSQARTFLGHCRRILKPGGIIRLIVPDGELYIKNYFDDRDCMLKHRSGRFRTRMEVINEVFRRGYEHQYTYDYETLALYLTEAGFVDVRREKLKTGAIPDLLVDQELREFESLFVEAAKPGERDGENHSTECYPARSTGMVCL